MSAKKIVSKAPKKAVRKFTKKAPSPPSYDELTAERIRSALRGNAVTEKRMFGGLCFMVDGKMCCGLTKSDLMVRVGKEAHEAALAEPHTRPMDFTGRPLTGFVYVDPPGYETAAGLTKWMRLAVAHAKASVPSRRKK
ncbi:MAG: TfoX/Sxy family protein [Polyangiaceae bacterium]